MSVEIFFAKTLCVMKVLNANFTSNLSAKKIWLIKDIISFCKSSAGFSILLKVFGENKLLFLFERRTSRSRKQ